MDVIMIIQFLQEFARLSPLRFAKLGVLLRKISHLARHHRPSVLG